MNRIIIVLFISAATACAGSWPQVPGLDSPYPAGATDLPAPTPMQVGPTYTYSFSSPQHPAAPDSEFVPSMLKLDTPAPANPVLSFPSETK